MEQTLQTVNILGVKITVTNVRQALELLDTHREDWRGRYVCACNVHTTVMAHDDPAFCAAENGAAMVVADGGPLSVVQRSRGFADAGHVTGSDLMAGLFARSAERGYRHFFYGSTEQTQSLLFEKLTAQYPGIQIAGGEASVFRPLTEAENDALLARINAAQPDYVWIGLGAPRQELFMAQNAGRVHALMLGVGGGFDVFAGNVQRAPAWMQKCCLEWLFRLLQEPKRLFKRYFVTNTRFLWLLWKERGK